MVAKYRSVHLHPMRPESADRLLVDMGNQRLKWRRVSTRGRPEDAPTGDGVIVIEQADAAEHVSLPDRLTAVFAEDDAPARILLSAVSQNEAVDAFRSWCQRRWGIRVDNVESTAEFGGLSNDYEDPGQLGCDRWLAALAAHRIVCTQGAAESAVVVDAGTAVTVDLVHRDHFIGGTIMPGLSTMVRVLGRDTGRIRLTKADGQAVRRTVVATNSDDAVHSGCYNAVCGGIDRCIGAMESVVGVIPPILFTGGDAALVSGGSKYSGEIRENLVLDGLAIVAEWDTR